MVSNFLQGGDVLETILLVSTEPSAESCPLLPSSLVFALFLYSLLFHWLQFPSQMVERDTMAEDSLC